jgi:galactose-1-phosphate uridylyltransferase
MLIYVWGNVSKPFFSETTRTVETKLSRNDHWKVLYKFYVFYADRKSKMAATAIPFMYSLAIIIFVVSEKKAFEHFPIGSNVNLCPAVVAILNYRSA